MHRFQTPLISFAALLLPALAEALPAAAQTVSAPPEASLETTPLVVKALGVSIRPPRGSLVSVDTTEGTAAISIVDGAEIPAWRMRIQERPTLEPGTPPELLATTHMVRMGSVGPELALLSRGPFQCGSDEGHLCYLKRSTGDGRDVVLGYLFLASGRERHLLVALLTTPDDLANCRSVLEASLATIELRTADQRSEEWRALTRRGRTFLDSITPDRLKALVGISQCLRIHKADRAGGDTEIGWSVVSTHAATREAVGANDPTDPQYARGPDVGLLVFIRGRMALQPERRIYQDFTIRYWMAWDQSEERWNVRAVARQGEAARGESEIGVRDRPASLIQPRVKSQRIKSHPQMLSVIQSSEATRSREPYEWPVPDAYLSQALGWLVGRLLPRAGTEPSTYGYYFYNNRGPQPELALRTDRWEPAADGSGHWRLTTRLGVDAAPTTSLYGRDGSLVQQTREDGAIVEPIDTDLLKRLWKSKGLDPGGAEQ